MFHIWDILGRFPNIIHHGSPEKILLNQVRDVGFWWENIMAQTDKYHIIALVSLSVKLFGNFSRISLMNVDHHAGGQIFILPYRPFFRRP